MRNLLLIIIYNYNFLQLIEKETIIKERLSKVAKVLGISYPCYETWLEHEEKINGSPLCRLKPSRRCCLDKPYTNRWKFICKYFLLFLLKIHFALILLIC